MTYAENVDNGVTLVSIQGAHTIDFAIAVLGMLDDVAALATTQYREIKIGGDELNCRSVVNLLACPISGVA